MDTSKKKKRIVVAITTGLLIIAGVLIGVNLLQTSQHSNIMTSFLKTYYNTNSHSMLDTFNDRKKTEDIQYINNFFDSLYQQKYKDTLNQEAYNKLLTTRDIIRPEYIVNDFDCKLELRNTKFNRAGDTFEGDLYYSFESTIKVTLSNNMSKEYIEKGSFSLNNEKGQWRISNFHFDRKSLYNNVKSFKESNNGI